MRQQASALCGLSNSISSVDMPVLLCGMVLKKLSCSALPQPPGQRFCSAGWGVHNRSSSWKLGIKTVFLPAQVFKKEQMLQSYCWSSSCEGSDHAGHTSWEVGNEISTVCLLKDFQVPGGRKGRVTSLSEILNWLLGVGSGSVSAGLKPGFL